MSSNVSKNENIRKRKMNIQILMSTSGLSEQNISKLTPPPPIIDSVNDKNAIDYSSPLLPSTEDGFDSNQLLTFVDGRHASENVEYQVLERDEVSHLIHNPPQHDLVNMTEDDPPLLTQPLKNNRIGEERNHPDSFDANTGLSIREVEEPIFQEPSATSVPHSTYMTSDTDSDGSIQPSMIHETRGLNNSSSFSSLPIKNNKSSNQNEKRSEVVEKDHSNQILSNAPSFTAYSSPTHTTVTLSTSTSSTKNNADQMTAPNPQIRNILGMETPKSIKSISCPENPQDEVIKSQHSISAANTPPVIFSVSSASSSGDVGTPTEYDQKINNLYSTLQNDSTYPSTNRNYNFFEDVYLSSTTTSSSSTNASGGILSLGLVSKKAKQEKQLQQLQQLAASMKLLDEVLKNLVEFPRRKTMKPSAMDQDFLKDLFTSSPTSTTNFTMKTNENSSPGLERTILSTSRQRINIPSNFNMLNGTIINDATNNVNESMKAQAASAVPSTPTPKRKNVILPTKKLL